MTEETIFAAALEMPLAERSDYLNHACGDDLALRKRMEGLLAASDKVGKFMARPAVASADLPDSATKTLEGGLPSNEATFSSDDSEVHAEALSFLSPSTRPDSLGRLGHYEVLQVLGKGGFGIVFRAFDETLQRVVAVKVMAPQLAATSPARKRFLREARTSAAVRHENVVQVYEVAEQPLPYLVMEFIPGETLQQHLDRTGPLDVSEVLRIGRQIAEGLAAAHATDLIHRDIKPANVLIEGGQHRVKITDFGLARAADDASISQSGIIAGTPMYMAPEQALGHKLDQRADLFSLGSVLYQMVAGRPPFRANSTVAVLKRVADDTPRAIREIIPEAPQWLCDIIAKLHAKNPNDRYQSAREVADVLADCEAQLKTHKELKDLSRIPHRKSRGPAPARSRRGGMLVVLIVLAVVGLGLFTAAGVALFLVMIPSDDVSHTPQMGKGKDEPSEPLEEGFVPLFNGKDLTGWKTHPEQPGVWDVKNGILTGTARQSHLFSERANFENFHLRTEMKINQGGDSGIRFRTPFKLLRGKEAWQVMPFGGYEAEFTKFSSASAQTGSVWRVNQQGAPNTLFRSVDPTLPHADEWCVYEVIANGNRFITRIDGKTVADCTDPDSTYAKGHFALQCFSPKTYVQFRKIEIKELPPNPSEFRNSIGMEFVKVPKGRSWLGGSKDKPGDMEVEVPADFYLGKYEVTQEEWQKVMGENPSRFSRTGESKDAVKQISDADLKRFPVDDVSWDMCQLFLAKLNDLVKDSGWVYRLPTEAEWEYACRGGPMSDKRDSAFDFYFAKPTNTLQPDQANFASSPAQSFQRTCKVGSYEPNRLGLHDMHGNVWEWCINSDKPASGVSRLVNRGGCWTRVASNNRAAFRLWDSPSDRSLNLGLRVARVPVGVQTPEAKAPPAAIDEKILQPLRDLVAAKARLLETALLAYEIGTLSAGETLRARIEAVEADVRLAEAEKKYVRVMALLELLVQHQRQLRGWAELRVQAGSSTAAELDDCDARIADVNARLAKMRNEHPVTEFNKGPQPRTVSSEEKGKEKK